MGPSGDLCNSLSAGENYSLSQSQVWPALEQRLGKGNVCWLGSEGYQPMAGVASCVLGGHIFLFEGTGVPSAFD